MKISWKYDDMDRLIEETRDADSTPGDGSDDYLTGDTIAGGDSADSSFQPRSLPENR